MARPASLILLPVVLLSAPAAAQERVAQVDVADAPLRQAIRTLSQQAQASIGIRDPKIARMRARPVRGRFTAGQALERMLLGSGLHARRVAPDSFVIEVARPAERMPRPQARPPAPPMTSPADPVEVVVTATKRDVPLAYYAGGAQVIDGDSLTRAEAGTGTDAIEGRVASVTSTHLGPGRNKLFIRGIADSSLVGPTQATVGQYWGNSRITYSAPDPSLRLYDVGSVEVLEGPQGTLYGAGSLGGVVRVVPRSPDLWTAGGSAWAGAQLIEHGDAGVDGGAILNLPIIEGRLGLRALAFTSAEGGYIDDRERGLEDVNRVRTLGGRATLRFEAGDDWTVDLSGLGQRIRGEDGQYADRVEGGLSRATSIAQPFRNDYWLTDLVARKRWDTLELTTSIGYAGQRVFERFEGLELSDIAQTNRPPDRDAPATAYTQDNRISMITGEVRLARRGAAGTGWLLAASALHNLGEIRRGMGEAERRAALTGVRNQVDEATLYGEYAAAVTRGVNLTLGGRLTHSRLAGQSRDVLRSLALSVDPAAGDSRGETRFLPSASLAWHSDGGLTLFARYQEGFRPGGIAVRQYFIQRFEGDRVSTFEAGGRYGARAFDTSLTISRSDWRNIQADLIDGFGFPTTANIGDGRVLSIGWTGNWRPMPGLELEAALYLNDSRVVAPAALVLPLLADVRARPRLPNVADTSARLGLDYTTGVQDGEQLHLRGYARYIGQSTLGIGSILGRVQGDHLDTGLSARIGDAKRGLSLSVTNLLDSVGNRFALGSPFLIRDQAQITPLQPRTLRIDFDVAF